MILIIIINYIISYVRGLLYRVKVLPSIDNTYKHQNGVEESETGDGQVHRDAYFNKNNSVKIQQTVGFYISSTISLSFFSFFFVS